MRDERNGHTVTELLVNRKGEEFSSTVARKELMKQDQGGRGRKAPTRSHLCFQR